MIKNLSVVAYYNYALFVSIAHAVLVLPVAELELRNVSLP